MRRRAAMSIVLLPLFLAARGAGAQAIRSGPPTIPQTGPASDSTSVTDSVIPPPESPRVRRVVRAFLDNDLFSLRDSGSSTDYDYTHGVGVLIQWNDAPASVKRLLRNVPGCAQSLHQSAGCVVASLGLRQAIYTPATNSSKPIRGQRPHAGYIGVMASVAHLTPSRTRTLQFDFGSTGKPALAEPLQKAIHAVTGTQRERGWANQIPARPVFAVMYDEAIAMDVSIRGASVRPRAMLNAQAGTLRTSAAAGADIQLSRNGKRLWTPSDGGTALPLGPYLLGGARQELVARDVFVDGHSGDNSITSIREPSVWQTMVGIGWRFAGGGAEYRHFRRGKEYRDQLGTHTYGSLIFMWHWQ